MLYILRLKMIQLAFPLIVVLLLPISGICADAKEVGLVYGVGTYSCSKFVEAKRNGKGGFYAAWATGYVTGVNWTLPDTYSLLGNTDIGGAMLWLENFCQTNPLTTFATALSALVHELYPTRTTHAPK